jgi:hypothetical protein
LSALTWTAGAVVVAFALAQVAFAVATWVAREPCERFVLGFASSVRAHVTEQALRLLAGTAFILYAPEMRRPRVFEIFGWVLIVTSALLLVLPWRWHHRFGQWVLPVVVRHLRLFSLGALALGGFVLWAVFWPLG